MTGWACLGAAHLDRIARAEAPVVLGSSNPVRVTTSPGGVARNVAETLARLGTPAALASRLGDDDSGRFVRTETGATGVDMSRTEIVRDAVTAGYSALLEPDGSLAVAFADMAIYDGFDGDRLADAAAGHARWFADANLPAAALQALIRRKPASVFLAVDAVSVPKAARLRPILGSVDLLFVNRDEARALTGEEVALAAATTLQALGVATVIVTRGPAGALLAAGDAVVRLPAVPATVRDVTGAGDALIGGTLHGLAKEMPMREAVEVGLATAAWRIGRRDAGPQSAV